MSIVQTWRAWPAVLIFARSKSKPLAEFVRRLDKQAKIVQLGKHRHFGVAAVYVSTDKKYPEQLGKWAEKQEFYRAIIAVEWSPGGPPMGWKISPDADVTIIFLERAKVRAVYGYRQGELSRKEMARILKFAVPFSYGPKANHDS